MAIKTKIQKKISLDEVKSKIYDELNMMKGIKVKGVDGNSTQINILLKTGKCLIKNLGEAVEVISSARFFSFWIWDLFLDRVKTKKVHNKVVQIINDM